MNDGLARLFIAVWPPAPVVTALAALDREDLRGVRFVPPENWHVTLRFFGSVDPDDVHEALDDVRLAPARARVGPAVDTLAQRALVVPVGGLDALARTVQTRTRPIGERPSRRFAGHLTLARVRRHAHMPTTLGAPVDASFDVGEIALVQSHLDPQGSHYETLHTWPLG